MQKKKVYDVADTNVELLGSAVDKKCKAAAAAGEPAWAVAGKKPGIQIWRMEKFKVKAVPQEFYGQFFTGDSYVCLNTYEDKETQKLKYDLHFWLGTETSQDEAGTAAYKTVELDTFLGDAPVQHREVEGKESGLFLSYFESIGGIRIQEGGIESGFNHVKPEEYRSRLLWLKGRTYVRVTEVPLAADSLCEGDVFVLDAGLVVYTWQGKGAGMNEKARAAQLARAIDDERKGLATVHVFNQDDKDIPAEFWEILGGVKKPRPPQGDDEAWEKSSEKRLMRLSDAGGKMEFDKVAEETRVVRDMLDSKDVFILDAGNEVFVWIGSKASVEEKRLAMSYAQKYLVEYKRPSFLPITRILEGGENEVFETHFNRKQLTKSALKKPEAKAGPQGAAEGCYLTYADASNGSLFLHWSKTVVSDGVLAFFKSGKPVAGFKFTKQGGREELTRETNSKVKNYFEGWCNYVKMAKEYGGEFTLADYEVGLYFLQGSSLSRVEVGAPQSLAKVDAVAVINGGNELFAGVVTTDISRFLNEGQGAGAALRLNSGSK